MTTESRSLPYSVLDVFAERALEGNALAVFHDARGLSAAQMQAIARELNLSETSFVIPADDAEQERREGVAVRIFTTQEELPFAGHPTLGTATWLHLHYPPLRGAAQVTLRLAVGAIPVEFRSEPGSRPGVVGRMRQREPVFGARYEAAEVAQVLGLAMEDLLPAHPPQSVSTGNAFCVVALRDLDALGRLAIPQREATAWLRERGMRWFYCVAPTGRTAAGEATWRARMQFYGGEDPATGSAAGPCFAWLVSEGLAASGEPICLEQGVEMLRPSRILGSATRRGAEVGEVWVGGRTVPVAEGRLFLPGTPGFPTGQEPETSIVTGM